jgi:Na+/proline symporter
MLVEPAVLALSLALYWTSWTFYGAVGQAGHSGVLGGAPEEI